MLDIFKKIIRTTPAPKINHGGSICFTAIGYPKTGNTWTRLMLGHYVSLLYGLKDIPLFDSLEELVPISTKDTKVSAGIFTHSPLEWSMQTAQDLDFDNVILPYLNSKVIFLTRHPLDVVVSLYMHEKVRLAHLGRYTDTLAKFVFDPVFGLEKLLKFHTLWAQHYASISSFLLWRYEDVSENPARNFRTLLEFLDLPINEAALLESVEFASFSNMRRMESSEHSLVYRSSGFRFLSKAPTDDPNAFHVRKGKVGGYRDEFDPLLLLELEQRVREGMPEFFGYGISGA